MLGDKVTTVGEALSIFMRIRTRFFLSWVFSSLRNEIFFSVILWLRNCIFVLAETKRRSVDKEILFDFFHRAEIDISNGGKNSFWLQLVLPRDAAPFVQKKVKPNSPYQLISSLFQLEQKYNFSATKSLKSKFRSWVKRRLKKGRIDFVFSWSSKGPFQRGNLFS